MTLNEALRHAGDARHGYATLVDKYGIFKDEVPIVASMLQSTLTLVSALDEAASEAVARSRRLKEERALEEENELAELIEWHELRAHYGDATEAGAEADSQDVCACTQELAEKLREVEENQAALHSLEMYLRDS